MKTSITNEKNGRDYEYITVKIEDNSLTSYDLVQKWNRGVECYKTGNTIVISLRKNKTIFQVLDTYSEDGNHKICIGCGEPLVDGEAIIAGENRHATCG